MKIAEIRELSTKELRERLAADTVAYNHKKVSHSVSPLDNPASITHLRKSIARMHTELRQRELTNK
jgi:large subunit ribosomal protein L29